jgi:hypothetical protein
MADDAAAIAALAQRITRLEDDVSPVPKLAAKQHEHANTLQQHVGQFDALLGPRDSLLTRVGAIEGDIRLVLLEIESIKGTGDSVQAEVGKLVTAYDLQRAHVVGRWQMRATTATAVIAAMSAVAVAALSFF